MSKIILGTVNALNALHDFLYADQSCCCWDATWMQQPVGASWSDGRRFVWNLPAWSIVRQSCCSVHACPCFRIVQMGFFCRHSWFWWPTPVQLILLSMSHQACRPEWQNPNEQFDKWQDLFRTWQTKLFLLWPTKWHWKAFSLAEVYMHINISSSFWI